MRGRWGVEGVRVYQRLPPSTRHRSPIDPLSTKPGPAIVGALWAFKRFPPCLTEKAGGASRQGGGNVHRTGSVVRRPRVGAADENTRSRDRGAGMGSIRGSGSALKHKRSDPSPPAPMYLGSAIDRRTCQLPPCPWRCTPLNPPGIVHPRPPFTIANGAMGLRLKPPKCQLVTLATRAGS